MVSSWVDLTSELCPATPSRGQITPLKLIGTTTPSNWCCTRSSPSTPPYAMSLTSTDYLQMLKEAMSADSSIRGTPLGSALISQCSTCKNSGTLSPKSPPNSPNVELRDCEELDGIFINRLGTSEVETIQDFLWDWSSLPSSTPPNWPLTKRSTCVSKKDIKEKYSRTTVASLLLTNLVSLILGAGLGMWLYRRTTLRGLQVL